MYFLLFHAGFMVMSFMMIALGIVIVKTPALKRRYFKYHRIAGITGTISGLLGLTAATVMVSVSTGEHVHVPHAWLGVITLLGMLGTLSLGFSQFKWKAKAQKIRIIHMWSGRTTALLLTAAAVTGILHAGIL